MDWCWLTIDGVSGGSRTVREPQLPEDTLKKTETLGVHNFFFTPNIMIRRLKIKKIKKH